MLTATNIHKRVGTKSAQTAILHGVTLAVQPGEMVAIMGPSGCGKSTLLGILAGLDVPTEGQVVLQGQDLYALSGAARDRFRNRHIGVIFQSHNLVGELNCADNISIPWVFADPRNRNAKRERIDELMALVGLEGKRRLYPHQLSGGEQQRASIARALLMRPGILFADEPTGSLDQENSRMILRMLRSSVDQSGHAAVLVTHDQAVAGQCDRIITMRDGRFVEVGV